MKLKDIADMEQYLDERCYCPGEIYDMTGIFYQVFSPDTECKYLCRGDRDTLHGEFVIAQADDEKHPQIIYIEITDGKVSDCTRLDATEHNIEQIIKHRKGLIDKMSFDEFSDTKTAESLQTVFKYADAIMVS